MFSFNGRCFLTFDPVGGEDGWHRVAPLTGDVAWKSILGVITLMGDVGVVIATLSGDAKKNDNFHLH